MADPFNCGTIKRMNMKVFSYAGLITCTLASTLALPCWANRYRIVDLGVDSWVTEINNSGTIVGDRGSGHQATYYRHGAWHSLPSDGNEAWTAAINESGAILGGMVRQDRPNRAVIWLPDQTMIGLRMPEPYMTVFPEAISNTGFVTGYYQTPSQEYRCFFWKPERGSVKMGDEDPGPCMAYDVNDLGQVVGEAFMKRVHESRAFLWEHGKMRDLGTLGGGSSIAFGINAGGEVVGGAETENNELHAFHWRHGKMTALGGPEAESAAARSINQKGDIVGIVHGRAARFENDRFVYLEDEVENLGDWRELFVAWDINDAGAIVGMGYRSEPNYRAFLLVPVE
jgi:probable HAF family extracellular repeat protein